MLSIPYWDSPGGAVTGYLMSLGFGLYMGANILIPAWWFIKGTTEARQLSETSEPSRVLGTLRARAMR